MVMSKRDEHDGNERKMKDLVLIFEAEEKSGDKRVEMN